eukprot:12825195-Ditylum_brightwellii.AAC.1
MKATTANNKVQHPSQHQRPDPPPPPATTTNKIQHKKIPGGGISKPFSSCPAFPKQLPLPSTIFTPASGGTRQK